MPPLRTTILALLAAAMLAGPVHAQQNGNTYNGVHNEPSQGSVRAKEGAAGVAPPSQERHRETQETDKLYNQLMKQEGVRGPAASATGTTPPAPAR